MSLIKDAKVLQGGEFLIRETSPQSVFTPEDFTEEQQMFADMTQEFIDKRVLANIEQIEKQKDGITQSLLEEAGELGLIGAAVPEQYGGIGVDIKTESILTERLGKGGSFSVTVAAHTGIGTLPILYFGTEAQKEKYLEGLATGQLKAAYCLTEPGSGSDALAARTKATLMEDGEHYLIEGQKMWITNAGFADVFTVFAKIDGKLFTGFIIDADSENIRLGAEEDKLGIKGSSTRQVFFEGVKVPKGNILGEIGKGHKIAFNVLNIGRYKLGVGVCGGAKKACGRAVKYANEREQFGQPISNFGAIQHKLAEMAVKIYATESLNYRIAGDLQETINKFVAAGKDYVQAKLLAAEEYAIECALSKVFGSETLDYAVDETVQIFGGNGYSEEFTAARAFRDARINRIFEGTNEINRLLAFDQLIKKSMRGQYDLMTPAMAVQKELMSIPDFGAATDETPLAMEYKAILSAKKAILMIAGAAMKKFGMKMSKEQEIVMNLADMLIEVYAAESAVLRTQKMIAAKGDKAAKVYSDLTQVFVSDALERINLNGKHAICAFAEGDEMRMMLLGLKRFTKLAPFNTVAARRRIAKQLISANNYCF
ncbi:MAG: acyl-CoA dehydrogenase family protein [Chitinophagales bacterium]